MPIAKYRHRAGMRGSVPVAEAYDIASAGSDDGVGISIDNSDSSSSSSSSSSRASIVVNC